MNLSSFFSRLNGPVDRICNRSRRYRRRYHPVFEFLEDRVAPAVQLVSLGDLSFYGDFEQSGSVFTGDGTTDLLQLGLKADDLISFTPLVSISNAVAFDTQNNANSSFTVTGDINTYSGGTDPILALFNNLSNQEIIGANLTELGSAADVATGPDIIEHIVGSVASIEFNPTKMYFADAAQTGASSEVWLQGEIGIDVLGVNGSVETSVAGNPIYVEINNGTVDGFAATLNEKIKLGSVEFDIENLSVSYTTSDDQLVITGETKFSASGSTIDVNWGEGSTSGLIIQDGALKSLDMQVTADIKLFGIEIGIPDSNPIIVNYSSADGGTFTMTGDLKLSTSDSNILDVTAEFSTDENLPGLKIVGGSVSDVNITVNGDINLLGLEIKPTDLNFQWQNGTDTFQMTGEMEVSTKSKEVLVDIDAVFGDENQPGMVVTDGELKELDITLNGEFDLFGVEITPHDVHATWDDQNNILQISTQSSPGITVKTNAFDATADVPDNGILINTSTGKVTVDDLIIDLSDVHLGGFTINDLKISYVQQGGETDFEVFLDMSFPQGWVVTGEMDLVNNEVRDVSLALDFGKDPIEIGATGLFLTSMDASVQNIATPSSLVVSGDLTVEYGKDVKLFGETVKFFSAEGSFLVDKDELKLDAVAYLGAITKNGSTTGILGTAHGDMVLDWSNQTYSLDVSASLLDGVFDWDADFVFDSTSDIIVHAKAEVEVPHGIPLIGGKELAELDFLLKYTDNNGVADGFVAAWTQIDLLFTHVTVGVQYDFIENKAKVVGSGTINADLRATSTPSQKTYVYSQPFVVPQSGAQQGTFSINWDRTFASDVTPTLALKYGSTTIPESDFTTDINDPKSTVSLIAQANINTDLEKHIGAVGSQSDPDQALPVNPGGAYTLEATFVSESAPVNKSVTIASISSSTDGFVQIAVSGGVPGNLRVGDSVTVAKSSVTAYNTQHMVTEITSSGAVITNIQHTQDATGGTMSGWTLPQFTATWHVPQPTITVSLPDQTPRGNLEVKLPVEIFSSYQDITTIDVYVDLFEFGLGAAQDFNGIKVSSLSGSDISNGMLTTQVEVTELLPTEYYVYAVINDQTNTPVTSELTQESNSFLQVFQPEFAFAGTVSDQAGMPLTGWTVFAEWEPSGLGTTTRIETTTNGQGFYGFQPNQIPLNTQVTVGVDLLDPDNFAFNTPSNGQMTFTFVGDEILQNFEINERSSIQGKIFNDQNQDGDPTQPGLGNWTVFIDSNGNGFQDPGEPTASSNQNGNFNFANLEAGTYQVSLALQNGSTATYTIDSVVDSNGVVQFGDTSGTVGASNHTATLENGSSSSVDTAASFNIEDHLNADSNNQILNINGVQVWQTNTAQFVSVPHRSEFEPGTGAFSAAGWIRSDGAPLSQSIAGLLETGTKEGGWDFRLEAFPNLLDARSVAADAGFNIVNADFNGDGKADLASATQSNGLTIVLNSISEATIPELITPTSVTVTQGSESFSAEYLIDNSGLHSEATIENIGQVTHASSNSSNSWKTDSFPRHYFADGGPEPIMVFDLGKEHSLTDLVAWNFSKGGDASQRITLQFSTDGGTTFTDSVNLELNQGGGRSQVLSLGRSIRADTVRMTIRSNYAFQGNGGDRVGLNEIKFLTDAVSFADPQSFAVGGGVFPSLAVADFNNDSRPDVVVANPQNSGDGTVSVRINTTPTDSTNVSFAPVTSFAAGNFPYPVTVGDVNLDGKVDIILLNETDDADYLVSVLLNTTAQNATTPTFASLQSFAISGTAVDIRLGDFNNDTMPDIAIVNDPVHTNGSVLILQNTTTAGASTVSFASEQSFAVGNDPTSLAFGDFNNDTKLDIAVTNQFNNNVSVLLNTTANGSTAIDFANQRTFGVESGPFSVAVGDFNDDGMADLAVVNNDSSSVSLLLNQTTPGSNTASFASQKSFTVGNSAADLAIDDFNLDGQLDVATTNVVSLPSNAFSVLINGGPASLLTLQLEENSTSGTGTLEFQASSPLPADQWHHVAFTYDPGYTPIAKFDFGTSSSPVLSGYTQVFAGTTYSATSGFGWLQSVEAKNRNGGLAPVALTRDLNHGSDMTFQVDLPNGEYNVTLTIGDETAAHDDIGIFLQGKSNPVDTVSSLTGQFLTKTYKVDVSDGMLLLNLKDLGGSSSDAVINGLTISLVETPMIVLYVDGLPVASTSDLGTLPINPDISSPSEISFNIGDSGGNTAVNPFAGFLDDISVWGSALTADQIQALFAGGWAPYTQTLPTNSNGYSVTIDNSGFDLSTGNNFGVVDTSSISGSLSGNALDQNGLSATPQPLAGWTVRLIDSANNVAASTVTNIDGDYLFTGVLTGSYQLEVVVQEGWQQTSAPNHDRLRILVAGQALAEQNFTHAMIDDENYLNGIVIDDLDGDGIRDLGEIGRENATVLLEIANALDLPTTTVAGGAFALPLTGVPDGTHQLKIVPIEGRVQTAPEGSVYLVTVENGVATNISESLVFLTTVNASPEITDLRTRTASEGKTFRITAEFADLDTPSATHRGVVEWGDGTTSVVCIVESNGIGTITASHVYADAGFYDTILTVIDTSDATVFAITPFTSIVSGATLIDGTLQIIGTDDHDRIVVSRKKNKIHVQSTFLPKHGNSFNLQDVDLIDLKLFAGNDHVVFAGNISVPLDVDDGDGNDRIVGRRHDKMHKVPKKHKFPKVNQGEKFGSLTHNQRDDFLIGRHDFGQHFGGNSFVDVDRAVLDVINCQQRPHKTHSKRPDKAPNDSYSHTNGAKSKQGIGAFSGKGNDKDVSHDSSSHDHFFAEFGRAHQEFRSDIWDSLYGI